MVRLHDCGIGIPRAREGIAAMAKKLTFREDGSFVIVQFSDTEFISEGDYDPDTPNLNAEARATMETVIAHEKPDPPHVSGFGNYSVTITDRDSAPCAALYFLDRGDYSQLPIVGGYDWIRRDQIDWYVTESRKRTITAGG